MERMQSCPECGGQTRQDFVKMALWKGERLIVIEDIPARVCDRCLEQYYDQVTRFRIDKLGANGFRSEDSKHVLEVPVFSLKDVELPQPEASEAEASSDPTQWTPDWSGFDETG
jgi:YgiT-type zinc finger domain-containing protein